MDIVWGALTILFAITFAIIGIHYTTRFYDHGWRPGWLKARPSMVSREQAAEDQPDWADYAAWLRNRYDR